MEIFVSEKELQASCDNYEFGKELVCEIVSQDSVLFKSLEQHDAEVRAEERDYIYNEMPKVLADSIIEITENTDKLEFYDLEKIARKFEQKLNELKGE